MKIGDTVEYISSKHISTGITAVITGFHENGRAFIRSSSGYEWMIKVDRLRQLNDNHNQKLT